MMWFLLSRDIWGSRMKTTEYKEKFERVFQQIGKATNSIWKVEEQANLLACKTHLEIKMFTTTAMVVFTLSCEQLT